MSDQFPPPQDPTAPPSDPPVAPPAPPVAPPAPPVAPPPPPPVSADPYATTYASAPPPMPAYGYEAQAMPGTLPYVERHFGPVATFGPRVGAFLIDALVSMIGLIPLFIGVVLLAMASDRNGGSASAGVAAMLFMVFGIIAVLAIQIWNRILRMGRTGQSIGKQVVGLKLIDASTGAPIGAGNGFLRELVSWIVSQVFYINDLWMLWDPNRQTLQDMVVKSTVIRVAKP